jgi:hypothetical protein
MAWSDRFGGQFAFVEVINSMQTPTHFPRVVGLSTLLMGAAFAGIGAIGYWCAHLFAPQSCLFRLCSSHRTVLIGLSMPAFSASTCAPLPS